MCYLVGGVHLQVDNLRGYETPILAKSLLQD